MNVGHKIMLINKPTVFNAPTTPNANCCPRTYVRTRNLSGQYVNHGHAYATQEMHAALVHKAKNGTVKYQYSIAEIHNQLRSTLTAETGNQGNIVVADLSFEISITDPDPAKNEKKRLHVTFPMKIPRYNRDKQDLTQADCYSSSDIQVARPLQLLKKLYTTGRKICNVGEIDHGQKPKYDGSPADGQLVRHSEQSLAAFLCTQEAVAMIANRISAALRSNYPDLAYGSIVKIYTAVLHIHSNKTPCGACEDVLIGLQNTYQPDEIQGGRLIGFTECLENELRRKTQAHINHEPNESFKFKFPAMDKPAKPARERGVRFFTTYSADNCDATHRIAQVAGTPVKPDVSDAPTLIPTGSRKYSNHLWVANFNKTMPEQFQQEYPPDTSQRTTFLSGSNETAATDSTKARVTYVSNRELQKLSLTGLKI